MAGLGARLKEARIAKGYSLDDLQELTKIQKRYLEAIEEENFSIMPGGFYARVFIKQYAEAVGADAEEMVALFKEENDHLAGKKAEIPPALQRSKTGRTNSKLKELLPQILVAAIIIVIIIIIYMMFREKALPDTENPAGSELPVIGEIEDGGSSGGAGETPPAEPVKQLELDSTAGETSTFTLTDSSKLQLTVKTSGDSWIAVTDENGAERMPAPGGRIMAAGETVEIDASDASRIRIRVGRTGAAELFVNGEIVRYPTNRGVQNIIIQKP